MCDFTVRYTQNQSQEGVKSPSLAKFEENNITKEPLIGVRQHIRSLPLVKSHYCRATEVFGGRVEG